MWRLERISRAVYLKTANQTFRQVLNRPNHYNPVTTVDRQANSSYTGSRNCMGMRPGDAKTGNADKHRRKDVHTRRRGGFS